MSHAIFRSLLFGIIAIALIQSEGDTDEFDEWRVSGGTKENIKYSSLSQIDTLNVSKLKVAWVYHTKDVDSLRHSQIQCNAIIIKGVLYGTSPQSKLFALDAATGKELWSFNPFGDSIKGVKAVDISISNNRGVAYWEGNGESRILFSAGFFLFAIDAKWGFPINDFGEKGHVDLRAGLGRNVLSTYVVSTSPGIVFEDLLIIGTRVSEYRGAAPGHIRAYDITTGEQKWIFHTIPQPGEIGYDTWEDSTAYKFTGGANAWAGFSLDEKRGMVFAPIGSAAYDFYGGKRKGSNLFANCILALNAGTGAYIWHYQTVHHDVWDKDLPNAPSLISIPFQGKEIDVVAQSNKSGFVFLLDRDTGKPIYPIEEKTVSTLSKLKGEKLSPTQPFPTFPKPFIRQSLSETELNPNLSAAETRRLRKTFRHYTSQGMFSPPSEKGTIFFPGLEGGANWGGASFDPATNLFYINANEVPWVITIKKTAKPKKRQTYATAGLQLYIENCMACHGVDKRGTQSIPSLENIKTQYTRTSLTSLINYGRRSMPGLPHLTSEEIGALTAYLLEIKSELKNKFTRGNETDAYVHTQSKFVSKEGYPASSPPWGSLNAINLATGEIAWKIPLGEYSELKDKGIESGTENYGGPVVTAGGLLFIAATRDGKIRAFNKKSGKLLWEYSLPNAGFATPSIFQIHGKQYIVIACGGGKLGTLSGDSYLAFSIP